MTDEQFKKAITRGVPGLVDQTVFLDDLSSFLGLPSWRPMGGRELFLAYLGLDLEGEG